MYLPCSDFFFGVCGGVLTAIGRFLGTLAVEETLKHGWKGKWSPVPWQVRQVVSSFCLLESWLGHFDLTQPGRWLFLLSEGKAMRG